MIVTMIIKNDRGTQGLTTGQDDMEMESPYDENCKYDAEKEDHHPEKPH